ncbi:hypothetical protein V6N13_035015 [Hibiscus sabdariffa]
MPPLMAFIPPIRALLLSPPPPLPLHRKEKKGSMPKETRVLYLGVLLSGGGFRRPMHVAIKQTRPTFRAGWAVGGEGMFPSDGFIFHPILNDRQDQTRCSGPVRASDRAEPYVCCREEGAGPSLNVRHPS